MASSVVYGKTKEHTASQVKVDGKPFYVIDAVFEVYCVIKQDTSYTIPEEITIQRITPRDGCSSTTKNMKIGDEAIVAIKPTGNGNFEYDERMPTLSATFPATKTNIISISSVCNLQSWMAPEGAEINRCPVCGVNIFSDNLMETATDGKIPCVFDGTDFSNLTNCESFSTIEIDMSATCIPNNFNQTCTKIMYSQAAVTCACDGEKARSTQNLLTEIDAGFTILPSFLTMFVSLISSLKLFI
ncbi:hypothetical protein ACF0H5_015986 [Mactra antiquata]